MIDKQVCRYLELSKSAVQISHQRSPSIWTNPNLNMNKISVDVSFISTDLPRGIGFQMRNSNGAFIGAGTTAANAGSSEEAECFEDERPTDSKLLNKQTDRFRFGSRTLETISYYLADALSPLVRFGCIQVKLRNEADRSQLKVFNDGIEKIWKKIQ
ncbi:hypothetical protein FRX31_012672 [Thalictrum thalictroides]|uniref:Uncharacterized protein n=1 Tax=Thalictrum thalictroides TaxID=46969 RepID=A0A7J6WK47_THATH|nr:hypothetical protein FRX31_012672 [Thalictrum thalictroides]